MTPVLIVASLTLLASFLCSLFEAALYTLSPARIQVMVGNGVKGARRLSALRAGVEEPIAAILTVNTIAHTVGSAWCGAMIGELYGSKAVGIFAGIFTFLVLALTEIVPKSVGVRYASRLGPSIVWPVQAMIWATWPVVKIAKWAMNKLTGSGAAHGPSEDEVMVVSGLVAKAGGMRAEEHRWVQNALRLDQVTAGDLRTPRTVVETHSEDQLVAELVAHPERFAHSRVPLTEGENRDKIVGQVFRRDVFDAAQHNGSAGLILRDLMRPIHFVPETMPAHELLRMFLADRVHMMAVADEYGGFEGVITLEDVLEEMLGREIVDEHDEVDDMQELALRRSRMRGEGAGSSASGAEDAKLELGSGASDSPDGPE